MLHSMKTVMAMDNIQYIIMRAIHTLVSIIIVWSVIFKVANLQCVHDLYGRVGNQKIFQLANVQKNVGKSKVFYFLDASISKLII